MGDLGEVSQQLAGEKDELSAALANLAAILGKVERFVKGNRGMLVADVKDLTTIVKTMGDEKQALEAILDIGPSAMGNLVVAFDPKTGSIGSRLGVKGNVEDLDGLLCQLVRAGQPDSAEARAPCSRRCSSRSDPGGQQHQGPRTTGALRDAGGAVRRRAAGHRPAPAHGRWRLT